MFQSLQELVLGAGEGTISDFAIKRQCREKGEPVGAVLGKMYASLQVMREAVAAGLNPKVESVSGLTGGNASLLNKAVLSGKTAGGTLLGKAATRALATAEYNAAMGRIVAAPTAGACGILPAALMTMQDEYGATDDHLVRALWVSLSRTVLPFPVRKAVVKPNAAARQRWRPPPWWSCAAGRLHKQRMPVVLRS